MMIQTPAQAMANRTARLVAEGVHRDRVAYTSTSESEQDKFLARMERRLCTDEYCFICSRSTDHFGEHTDEQILAAAKKRGQR